MLSKLILDEKWQMPEMKLVRSLHFELLYNEIAIELKHLRETLLMGDTI